MRVGAVFGLLTVTLWLALPAGLLPAADFEARYREAAASFHSLRAEGGAQPAQWRALAESFRGIQSSGPGSRRGADALYSAALSQREAYRVSGEWRDLSGAVAGFRSFVNHYPQDRLADDSLMHLADLVATGYDDLSGAQQTYRQVLTAYPEADQVPAAKKRLAALTAAIAAKSENRPAAAASTFAPSATGASGPSAARASPATVGGIRPGGANGGRLKRVQYWSALQWTRIIFTTDPFVPYRFDRLTASGDRPNRLYFDLLGAQSAPEVPALINVDDALLTRIRVDRFNADTTRVVLDLKEIAGFEVKDFLLPNERKIVVDLLPPKEPLAAGVRKSAPARARSPRRSAPAADGQLPQLTLQSSLGLKVKKVMIDPGHGGRDPGAVAFGLQEKNVVLKIAGHLRALLKKKHRKLQVGMTRESDRFISLQNRPLLAKQFGADLFVSIHLNANPFQRFHGVETYFLNLTRDASALRVAARENATTEKRVSDLNAILVDLLRDTNIVESSALARTLHASLLETLQSGHRNVRNLGVKQAPFLVLMGAEMPGVLVEAGFVTNRRENKRLRDTAYLDKIAEGIYEGLRRYIEQQNPVAAHPSTASLALNARF